MFEKNQDIHFSCTQCGKCCSKPPRVNFYDMLELSDKFIFQTAHHTMISYAQQPLDKILCEHYQIIGHTIMMPELEASLFYFIDFIPIQLNSYKNCVHLKENMCSIYGQRPASCRIAPFNAFYDEEEQWRSVNFFKNQAEINKWDCSFKDESPLIYKSNNIYGHGHSAIYHQEILHIRHITDKYIEFLSLNGDERKTEHFKALFNAMQKNALVITDIIFILQAARYFNLISEQLANSFILNQKELIENELKYALNIKNKDNIQTSRLYKRMVEDYEKVLSKNIFKEELLDSFIIE